MITNIVFAMNIRLGKNVAAAGGFFIQLLVWISVLVVLPLGWKTNWPEVFWVKQGITLVLFMGVYYFNSMTLIPRLLLKQKTALYIGSIILSILIVLAFMQLIEHWLNLAEQIHRSFNPDKPYHPRHSFRFDIFLFVLTLLVFGISTSVTLISFHYREKEARDAFEKQKIATELATLKSQINPHFYFNTLNNIYALAAIDAALTQKAIHMLSKMMRYVLYESQKTEVLLSQEISFIDNYIELMRLRMNHKVEVVYSKPNLISEVFIAPMLFMPFVENAFKHGINPKGKSQIIISIDQEGSEVKMIVKNEVFENEGMDIEENEGIGISNTKRRLELLYPNRHILKIKNVDDEHLVVLSLELKDAG